MPWYESSKAPRRITAAVAVFCLLIGWAVWATYPCTNIDCYYGTSWQQEAITFGIFAVVAILPATAFISVICYSLSAALCRHLRIERVRNEHADADHGK